MDIRLRILLDQLDQVWDMLEGRLTGRRMVDGTYEGEPGHLGTTLTDEEYFWEFDELLAWTNTEFTHHAAEIACLRDLYYWTQAGG